MTKPENEMAEDIPRLDPWLGVALAGLVPMTAAFMMDAALVHYLVAAGGALITTSVVMLVRQERSKRRTP